MTYQVEISEPAACDADAIFDWINKRSPDGALRWWQALQESLKRLEHNPAGLARAPESDSFAEPLYQTLFRTRKGRTYRALYIVRADTVHILRIRGPRQDLIADSDIDLPDG